MLGKICPFSFPLVLFYFMPRLHRVHIPLDVEFAFIDS